MAEITIFLMRSTGIQPQTAFVDLGYRGVDKDNPGLSDQEKTPPKRSEAIEPILGHLKAEITC